MQVEDLRSFERGAVIDTDLCIVGSGPAGLTLAGEFSSTPVRTLVVESGGLTEDAQVDELSQFESIGVQRVMDHRLVRNRIFGGTSHTWTGRCAPFDDVDFSYRPWIPFSGWPIKRGELDPFLARATSYLGLEPACYDERLRNVEFNAGSGRDVNEQFIRHCYWQYSTDSSNPLDYMRFGRAFLSRIAPNVRILLHATVTHLNTNCIGTQLTSVEVSSLDGKVATIRPRILVLCTGGIDNARILLSSNRVVRSGIGNQNDLVGRFLMDHPRCVLAEFDQGSADELRKRYGLFRLGRRGYRNFFVRGLSLSPAFQEQKQLLNCAAWLTEDRAPDDPWDAVKRLLSGKDRRMVHDLWSVLSQPQYIVRGLSDRLLRAQGLPHKLRRLVLDCIVEQRPDLDSRIVLSDKTDRVGVPMARLDWRISEQERTTVATFGGLIRDEFRRIGLPVPILTDWVQSGRRDQASFADVFHPTGTTRMARDPRQGVVDQNCQIHGMEGVFIAGSSVFPTTGHANPTLMLVALAIRLADWLKNLPSLVA